MLSTSQKTAARKSGSRKAGRSSRLMGVDFGSHSLKLSEVERGPLGPVVRTFGVTPYLKNKKGEPDIVRTLDELTRASRCEANDVLLTLSPLDVFMVEREYHYENQPDPKQIEQTQARLKAELSTNLVNRSVILPLAPTINYPEQLIHLSFAIVPNQIIDFYQKAIEAAGLNLAGLQYAPHAIGRSLADFGRTAVLEMGAQTSSWYLHDHGHLVQKATLPYGGEALTEALALANGCNLEEAEEHKRSLTGPSTTWPSTSATVVKTFLDKWWEDLFSMPAETPAHMDNILTIGGGARFTPMREQIFEKFGILPDEWTLPEIAHVSEDLRQYLDPQLPVLVNSLALLVNV